jgi:NAD(P) transhydrogenase subunit beta
MVGLLNGLGRSLLPLPEFWRLLGTATNTLDANISILLDVFIGGVTFTGSMVALLNCNIISGSPITFPLQQPINALLLVSFVGSAYLLITPDDLLLPSCLKNN